MERIKEHEILEAEERAKILIKKNKKKKKTGEVSEEEEQAINHEEVEFKLANQFDNQLKQLKKVDYEMVQKKTQGLTKALAENDLKTYEKIDTDKMDKKELDEYIKGEEKVDKNEINLEELNKDYGKDLDQGAYQDFWKNEPRKKGSQSVKPQRPGSQEAKLAALPTPERKRRQIRDQFFPEIQKNSVWKNKDIDVETLYEDPLFDFNRPYKKRRMQMSIEGGVLNFGKPMLPKLPQTSRAESLPEIGEDP